MGFGVDPCGWVEGVLIGSGAWLCCCSVQRARFLVGGCGAAVCSWCRVVLFGGWSGGVDGPPESEPRVGAGQSSGPFVTFEAAWPAVHVTVRHRASQSILASEGSRLRASWFVFLGWELLWCLVK